MLGCEELARSAPRPEQPLPCPGTSLQGGRVKLEDLLGKHVRYKGEEGRIVEGHSGEQASVVVSIRGMSNAPRRNVTVLESEWQEFELLG